MLRVSKTSDEVMTARRWSHFHNVVEGVKHLLETKSPEENQATEANQTGTEGFDAAEAVTKPVNEDGQEGDKPKPEIAL